MLPDMSDTLGEWALPHTIKAVTETTVDFVRTPIITGRTIDAVVQVADKNKLNTEAIDWSLRYLQVHSAAEIANGEFLEYHGEDYKIIDNGDYQLYGFTEAVAEQTKQPLLVVTP